MMALVPQALLAGSNFTCRMTRTVGVLSSPPVNPTLGALQSLPTVSITTPSTSSSRPGSKRPRLTVNTCNLPPAFANNKSTSLRLETLSVTSPTSVNTFSNSYGQDSESSLRKPLLTIDPALTLTSDARSKVSTPSSTPAFDSVTSASSTEERLPTPYRLSFTHSSILKNGPIPRKRRRVSFSTTRPMFPSSKRVAFCQQLTEEIRTSTYVLAHSDLDMDMDVGLPSPSLPKPVLEDAPLMSSTRIQDCQAENQLEARLVMSSPRAGDKRESSSDEDEEEDALYPKTPIAGRMKRRREWTWTLGQIPGQGSDSEQKT